MEFIRFLLFPLAFLYTAIMVVRNKLYDWGAFKSIDYDVPLISVGNLSVGGTGKTPHIEYLIRLLHEQYGVAVLSRGYGRRTSGYRMATTGSAAEEIGDEPRQFKQRFRDIAVAVSENRMLAIPQVLMDVPRTDVILLDDAYQHRGVIPGMSILLTDYNDPFTRDFILPAGRLREPRSAYKRADVIIVSKCPPHMTPRMRQAIIQEIKPLDHQQVFFSYIRYHHPYATFNINHRIELTPDMEILLICGVAAPEAIEQYLETKVKVVRRKIFPDHHNYDRYDLETMKEIFNNMESGKKIIVTTEKDAMRLHSHRGWVVQNKMPLYSLPIEVDFFEPDKAMFNNMVADYVERTKK